jgi:hypothetical protein
MHTPGVGVVWGSAAILVPFGSSHGALPTKNLSVFKPVVMFDVGLLKCLFPCFVDEPSVVLLSLVYVGCYPI